MPCCCRPFSQPASRAINTRADVRSTIAGVYITDRVSNLKVIRRSRGTLRDEKVTRGAVLGMRFTVTTMVSGRISAVRASAGDRILRLSTLRPREQRAQPDQVV